MLRGELIAQFEWRAMGTIASVRIRASNRVSARRFGRLAVRHIAALERRWSRFAPRSDVRRVSDMAGSWVSVSAETLRVIETSIDAWHLTKGAFDVTVGASVEAIGYRNSFDSPRADRQSVATGPIAAAGAQVIEIDDSRLRVRVARGTRLDLGGIGKGAAADAVAQSLIEHGAMSASVSIGGDVRVLCSPKAERGVVVCVRHPTAGREDLFEFEARDVGVASSSRLRRAWANDAGMMHHVVDPSTGLPTTGPIAASAIAPTAALAEVLATSAMVRDNDSLFATVGAHGFVIDHEMKVREVGVRLGAMVD